jgi:hypothetical protein
MDGRSRKSVECPKPTDEGKENKVRGHRQRRSENKQIDKHPERYSIGTAIFW